MTNGGSLFSTDGKVYIDGTLAMTFSDTVDATVFNRNFLIGADRNTDGIDEYIQSDSMIDQVRIFNRALTEDEIQLLYYEEKTKFNIADLNLANPPTKVFIGETPLTAISLEQTEQDIIQKAVEKEIPLIKSETTQTQLTMPKDIIEVGETIFVENVKEVVDNTKKQNIDTTSSLDIFGDSSCVAAYPLDGSANDLSGNHNGTWHGTEQYDVGKFGQAAKFDGNSYITANNIDYVNFKSISLWLYPVDLSTQQGLISFDDKDVFLYHSNSGILAINNNGTWYSTNCNIQINTFNHIVINFDPLQIYVNGELQYNSTNIFDVSDRTVFGIGVDFDSGNANDFIQNGTLIDQVRIFNRALTDGEVQALYYEQKTTYDITHLNLLYVPKTVYTLGKLPLEIITADTNFIEVNKGYPTKQEYKEINIKTGDKILTDLGEVEVTNSEVSMQSIVNNPDPFNDNSGVALWQLDGNALDTGGNYNGTWSGTEQYDTGVFGQAAKFDGSSYIETPLNSFTPPTITISFWLKHGVVSTADQYCVFHFSKNNENTFVFWLRDDNGDSSLYINNTEIYVINQKNEDNNWHFYTFTSNGKAFIDGVLYQDFGFNVDMTTINKNFLIGADRDSNAINDFVQANTMIDQVRIFNRALIDDEIQILYNEEIKKIKLYHDTLTQPVTRAYLLNRAIPLQPSQTTYDLTTDTFISTYEDIEKRGRAIQRRILLPDNNIEVIPPIPNTNI